MHVAPIALAIMLMLLLLGYRLRAPITVALFASLPFASTAIVTLPALGGSSILLFTPLAGLLILTALARRNVMSDLGRLFSSHWVPAVVATLLAYAVAGALILPRLFAGQTTVFIPGAEKIIEVPLMPVTGNITQSGYFAANGLCFFAVSILLRNKDYFRTLKVALFALAATHAGLCLLDLAGKFAGIADVLSPIRTAGYSMLTDVKADGFWRIVGGCPEASSAAAGTATAFAFTFSYWRMTGSLPAFVLTAVLGSLLVFSTSTTGYAVLGALSLVFLASLAYSAMRDRINSRDLWVVALGTVMLSAVFAMALANEQMLDPIIKLLEGTILEKATSASAAERFYWNYKSLLTFLDTNGLGAGLGSSRASSWLLAVLSQLGFVGAVLFGVLVIEILKRPFHHTPAPEDVEIAATCMGIRAATFATLVALLTSGGAADPGLLFFTALAALLAGRCYLAAKESAAIGHRALDIAFASPSPFISGVGRPG